MNDIMTTDAGIQAAALSFYISHLTDRLNDISQKTFRYPSGREATDAEINKLSKVLAHARQLWRKRYDTRCAGDAQPIRNLRECADAIIEAYLEGETGEPFALKLEALDQLVDATEKMLAGAQEGMPEWAWFKKNEMRLPLMPLDGLVHEIWQAALASRPGADERARFEERAFNQRFLMSVQKVGTGCMTFQAVDCPTMSEFVKRRDDGSYEDQTLNVMWWAWQTALGMPKDKA